MHNTPPNPDRQYATSLDHSPIGPTTRTAVSGLAPSPLASSSSRARPQYADHLSHHSDSFGSSTYSERPSSYVSQGSSSSRAPTARSSPALPPVQSMALSDRNRNLPPINTYGDSIRSSDPRYTTPPQSARYPGPSYGGVPAQDYGQYSSRASYSSTPSSYGPLNFDNLSDYGDGNKKRRRGNLPKQVTDILRSWFTDHIAHPYPTEDEKIGLMHLTGLTMSQVRIPTNSQQVEQVLTTF